MKKNIALKNEYRIYINTKVIYDYMKEKNLTKEELAKKCFIELYDLEKILHNSQNTKLYHIVKMSRIMNIEYDKFFKNV